jgi:hypothetical protein
MGIRAYGLVVPVEEPARERGKEHEECNREGRAMKEPHRVSVDTVT